MKNIKKLKALMNKYELQAEDVAKTLDVKLQTVQAWLSVGQTAPIPDTKLRLLELLLKDRRR